MENIKLEITNDDGNSFIAEVTPELQKLLETDKDFLNNTLSKLKENQFKAQEMEDYVGTWTDEKIQLLIQEYKKRSMKFRSPEFKKKDLWAEIKKSFLDHNYVVSTDELDKKFRNMKQTYRRIKDAKKATGRGAPSSWKFFRVMEEIFYPVREFTQIIPLLETNAKKKRIIDIPATITSSSLSNPLMNEKETSPDVTFLSSSLQPETSLQHSLLYVPTLSPVLSVHEEISLNSSQNKQVRQKKTPLRFRKRKNISLLNTKIQQLEIEKEKVSAINALAKTIEKNNEILKELIEDNKKRTTILERLVDKLFSNQ